MRQLSRKSKRSARSGYMDDIPHNVSHKRPAARRSGLKAQQHIAQGKRSDTLGIARHTKSTRPERAKAYLIGAYTATKPATAAKEARPPPDNKCFCPFKAQSHRRHHPGRCPGLCSAGFSARSVPRKGTHRPGNARHTTARRPRYRATPKRPAAPQPTINSPQGKGGATRHCAARRSGKRC